MYGICTHMQLYPTACVEVTVAMLCSFVGKLNLLIIQSTCSPLM